MRRAYLLLTLILLPGCAVGNSRRVGEDGGGPSPVCGNGVLEAGEECDDGNTENGDGCSDACTFENCSSENCWWGCCDKQGQCVAGTEDNACGAGGVPCVACSVTGQHCEEQFCESLPTCIPDDTLPCGRCGTRHCGTDGTWGDCYGEGVCVAGAEEESGTCGNCGILRRLCDSTCAWGSWTCSDEGDCSPGALDTGGSCGVGGYEQRSCQPGCTWGNWTCEGEGDCTPNAVETGVLCGNCGTLRRTCLSSGTWGDWTCIGQGVCASGTSQTGNACGNCGTEQRTCKTDCTWGDWTCLGQGVCSPGTKDVGSACCYDANYVKTCQNNCTWGASVCTGNTTCSTSGHLTCGENNQSCAGVAEESWRCVWSVNHNATVSQVCRNQKWVNFHLLPRDCRGCCPSYSLACRQEGQ